MKNSPEPALTGHIRGIIFHFGLIFSALMYVFVLFFIGLPLLILEFFIPSSVAKKHTRPIFHKAATLTFTNWSATVGRLLVWVYGMKFYATPIIPTSSINKNNTNTNAEVMPTNQEVLSRAFAAPPAGKVNILIMNHRTVLDWLFFWGALAQCEYGTANQSLKIVPKETLSKAPIFGWAMQCFRFLFLSRKSTEGDLSSLAAAAESYCLEPSSEKYGPTILIFPEGTDLSAVHIEKSQAFSKKNDLPIWNKVLAPRALGLGHFIRSLGKNRLHQLLDVTIAYEDYVLGERPTESALIKGRAPRAQHVAVRRFSADPELLRTDPFVFPLPECAFVPGVNLTTANPKFESFVRGLFAMKEEVLTNFYAQREEKKNFMAVLESPCGGGGDGDDANNNKEKSSSAAARYAKTLSDYKEIGMKATTEETWLKISELRLRTMRGWFNRIVVPFGLALIVFLMNYYYFGFKVFLSVTIFFFLFVRFLLLRKPIHRYFFDEYNRMSLE